MRTVEALNKYGAGEPLVFSTVGLLSEPINSFIANHLTELLFLTFCSVWVTFWYRRLSLSISKASQRPPTLNR